LNKAKEPDNEVMSYEPKTSSQNTVLPQTTTDYSAPKSHYEADDWVMHGKQPQQVPKQKPITTVQPQNPSGTKPISYYDLGEDEKQKLQADENVLAWQQSQPQIPTDEMYDAQIGYYNNMVAKAQDDYVNAFGQSSEADASEKDWSDYSDKVDGLVAQRDAYNRAKMGMDEGDTNSGDNEFVHGTQYFGSGDNEKPVPDIVQNHPHQEGDESLGIFNEGAFSGGGSGAGGSWGEGDEKLSLEDIQRINQVTSLSRSFLSTTDNKGAAESEAIMIDFTTPEFEQAIEMYSYLKDGKSIGEDLAAQIVEGYPKIAEKWGYDRLVVEINLHYMLYQMGYETDRTKICNISNEKDTSWEIVEKLTEFQKFSDNLQLPK